MQKELCQQVIKLVDRDYSGSFHPTLGILAAPPKNGNRFAHHFTRDAGIAIEASLAEKDTINKEGLLEAAKRSIQTSAHFQRLSEPNISEYFGDIHHELKIDETGMPTELVYLADDAPSLFTISVFRVAQAIIDTAGNEEATEYLKRYWENIVAASEHDRIATQKGTLNLLCTNPQKITGLYNRCWKDSSWSMIEENYTIPQYPHYYFSNNCFRIYADSKIATMAKIISLNSSDRQEQDELLLLAEKLDQKTKQDKDRLHELFWMDDRQLFAPLLIGNGRKVAIETNESAIGLWLGIVDSSLAKKVAERMSQPDLLTPWGIRTRSSKSLQFTLNERKAYQNGMIWPWINWITCKGYRNYGLDTFAEVLENRIASATIAIGNHELFGVDPNTEGIYYYQEDGIPRSCEPQTFSTFAAMGICALNEQLRQLDIEKENKEGTTQEKAA